MEAIGAGGCATSADATCPIAGGSSGGLDGSLGIDFLRHGVGSSPFDSGKDDRIEIGTTDAGTFVAAVDIELRVVLLDN